MFVGRSSPFLRISFGKAAKEILPRGGVYTWTRSSTGGEVRLYAPTTAMYDTIMPDLSHYRIRTIFNEVLQQLGVIPLWTG